MHGGSVVFRIRVAKDVYAIVDDEDAVRVSRISWKLRRTPHTRYAFTTSKLIGNSQKLLHRFILGLKPGEICDHVNGNGLDNRRSNLRVVTAAQNAQNCFLQRREAGKSSRFKGVTLGTSGWSAQINSGGLVDHLGVFPNEEEAARAYDRAALERFGAFARTNEMMGLFGVPVRRNDFEVSGPTMPTPEALDPELERRKLHRSRAQHRRGQQRLKEIEYVHGALPRG